MRVQPDRCTITDPMTGQRAYKAPMGDHDNAFPAIMVTHAVPECLSA